MHFILLLLLNRQVHNSAVINTARFYAVFFYILLFLMEKIECSEERSSMYEIND